MKLLKIGSSEAHNRFSSGLWICLGAMKGALTPSLCNGASSSDQRGSILERNQVCVELGASQGLSPKAIPPKEIQGDHPNGGLEKKAPLR